MFANNVVRALLPVCSQVAVAQVVTGQTLVSRYSGAFENRQEETWESPHVNFVGRHFRCRANRIVVSELDVREPQIPVVLLLVDDHSQHLGHSVVHPLNASVAVRIIGACGKLGTPNSWYIACESLEQNCRPLSESMLRGHPHKGMYLLTRMLAVPSAVNSAAVTANISARRLKRLVINKM